MKKVFTVAISLFIASAVLAQSGFEFSPARYAVLAARDQNPPIPVAGASLIKGKIVYSMKPGASDEDAARAAAFAAQLVIAPDAAKARIARDNAERAAKINNVSSQVTK